MCFVVLVVTIATSITSCCSETHNIEIDRRVDILVTVYLGCPGIQAIKQVSCNTDKNLLLYI